jgi:hypothetical protein
LAVYFFFPAFQVFRAVVPAGLFVIAAARFAGAFLPTFLAHVLRPAGRLALGLRAMGFFAEAFLAPAFFAAVFLAAGFLIAGLATTGGMGATTIIGLRRAAGAGIGAVIRLLV